MSYRAELRGYYEAEAEQRLRGPLRGLRIEWRSAFIDLLHDEQRTSVVDFGAGPGRDVAAFGEAGLDVIGFDLAIGNARLAHEGGMHVVPADIVHPPVRRHSFDAAWSMSTLMHLGDDEARRAVQAMGQATIPGSPMMVGIWGGDDVLRFDEQIEGQRRPFYRRSVSSNAVLFSQVAMVESVEAFDIGSEGYQLFHLRSVEDHV